MRRTLPLNQWNFSIEELNYRKRVTIPHTWNVEDEVQNYRGRAKYETEICLPKDIGEKSVEICFHAVYHCAEVYINGKRAGEHTHSGYTPFSLDITGYVLPGESNRIVVICDNTHVEEMLPHNNDFDWADDGGIIRAAEIVIREKNALRFLHVEEEITAIQNQLCSGRLFIQTEFSDGAAHKGIVRVIDYADNRTVIEKKFDAVCPEISIAFENLKLWSCFTPNLYRIGIETEQDYCEIRTGLRKIETRGEKILLNDEEIFFKGCEWMPGSNPDFGMAEPLSHSIKCLRQLKDSGCVFTRFHWQQDDSLFDWCDENGLLVQEEIPYWGHPKEAGAMQLTIAKQQADEMLKYHKNHPSIIFWGVGNELDGTAQSTIDYVDSMITYIKAKDKRRLVNYVSNTVSLDRNIDRDDATLHGDVAMWNDYLGLWEPCDDVEGHIRRTAKKCEGKPLVVTEFGLCEPHFQGGDERRCEILKERIEIYKSIRNIKGYVWFSLNDYRTHVGEQGEGKLRQRVHGSTDLYGNEKPSYRQL